MELEADGEINPAQKLTSGGEEMSEEVVYRRTPSPGLLAMRNERKLLSLLRKQIGDLQKRTAFAEARATSPRTHDTGTLSAEVDDITLEIKLALDQIEELMQGSPGVGPAEDCRKALRHLSGKLAALPQANSRPSVTSAPAIKGSAMAVRSA